MTTDISGWVKTITVPAPSLQNNTADAERVLAALKPVLKSGTVSIDLGLLRKLPGLVRSSGSDLRCVLCRQNSHWTLIGLLPESEPAPPVGIAIDLGTSRVVLRLVDLLSGDFLAESAFDNPQIAVGPDILTRIHHTDQPEGLKNLQDLIVTGLNREIAGLCRSCGRAAHNLVLAAVAGNTAMSHLFMGLDPKWMIREPYIPVVNRPDLVKAADLGLDLNPLARVFIFPNIGSYFGGDLIAGILFSRIHQRDETTILVDVGTNAEVVLGNKNWLIACAGAAGPALEGGVTKMGMMAGPGVIDQVTLDPDSKQFHIGTIDDLPPVGICGSGLIDLAACLFLSGMLDIRGKFVPDQCNGKLTDKQGLAHFVVVPGKNAGTGRDLTISQADIDSLIRSKAAMYTILETISESVGTALADLSAFFVAGTFGSFINPRSAISIGMLPDLPLTAYRSLGNSSLGGATRFLTDADCPAEIDRIRDSITYLELNVNQDFMNRFSAAKFLPHTNAGLFPSVVRVTP
jgi:uncharacterized 2Fe-2S/4Fe-4S cluster protein (DUF4445 family)